ncbi:hypothetical protein SCHPADRAFT_1001738 [Schizopora paradoxa]|uniref:Polynucleotide 5'-hydroxyl-kinase GRC3 n=1 Tax=Schizopora paradoxa TaxID=27342 RepID=A0A0H2R6B7_9AGAM|nr:hypothetical protein SCHPADRAFT_1001738 [Schizopora paradoxa]
MTCICPPAWRTAIEDLVLQGSLSTEGGRRDCRPFLLSGAKNVGKSSFARVLLNRLLSNHPRVAYLECDPGQPEFTSSGLLSLHLVDEPVYGPPFSHLRTPYRSHFLGSTSPRNNPSYYISCIESLIETYTQNFRSLDYDVYDSDREVVPLVVNTMGWTKGLGGDLLKKIEELVMPSHIITIGEVSELRSSDNSQPATTATSRSQIASRAFESPEPQRINVESIPYNPESARYTSADWRALSLMSYFHSSYHTSFSDIESLLQWNTNSPLLSNKPYAVSPRAALDSVILTGSGSDDVVPSEIGRVLNGAIVAFVTCEPGSVDASSTPRSAAIPYVQGAPLPDPRTSNCLGLGLIRGVSPSLLSPEGRLDEQTRTEILHIITPVPLSVLRDESCRCIVKGEIELPVWGMTDSRENLGGSAIDIPYLQSRRSTAAGADRKKVRRNIMRRSQF